MLTASPIELLNIIVPERDLERATSRLVELGIFEPVDIQKIEKELTSVTALGIEQEIAEWQGYEGRLRELSRILKTRIVPSEDIENIPSGRVKEIFTNIDQKISHIILQKEELSARLKNTESTFSQVKDYFTFPIRRNAHYSFLYVALGEIDNNNLKALKDGLKEIPHLAYPLKIVKNKISALLIGLKKDRNPIEETLKNVGWLKIEIPAELEGLSKDIEERLRGEIEWYKTEIEKLDLQVRDIANNYLSDLSKISSLISLKKTLLDAKRYSYKTDRTAILSGWVLREDKERAAKEIKKICSASYVEKKPAEELNISKEDVPVFLKHNVIFKPFELLINSYGIPRYGNIDPTVFVAMSFLFMFGAMFGDLGQGLCLVLAGFLLMRSRSATAKQAATLLIYCGLSASIFGIFYGTVFGFEDVIKPLFIRPMESINQLFGIAIIFGMIIITLGLILNIINTLRDRDYIKTIFDKTGLITGIIYWVAIACVSKLFIAKASISPIYIIVIMVGLSLVFLKPAIEVIAGHKKENESVFIVFMESMVDILEIAMGYLANTVSFIRIAAFALAHVGLFLAIFGISHMLKNIAGGSLSILIIILGNILVIALEGMVATIQSLRLNYYEFFSKFFITGKRVYKPLTIDIAWDKIKNFR